MSRRSPTKGRNPDFECVFPTAATNDVTDKRSVSDFEAHFMVRRVLSGKEQTESKTWLTPHELLMAHHTDILCKPPSASFIPSKRSWVRVRKTEWTYIYNQSTTLVKRCSHDGFLGGMAKGKSVSCQVIIFLCRTEVSLCLFTCAQLTLAVSVS